MTRAGPSVNNHGQLTRTDSAIINNVTYVDQKVPTLYTALSVGRLADNPVVYGQNSIPLLIKSGEIVELIINNHDVSSFLVFFPLHNC